MAAQHATWHDAYDAQMALWRWEGSETGLRWLAQHYHANVANIRREAVRDMLQDLYVTERQRLIGGSPVFVSAEMCQLIEHAHAHPSFELEPLLVTDLLMPHGFIYFETPFDVLDKRDAPHDIKAVSFSPYISQGGPNEWGGKNADEMMAFLAERNPNDSLDRETPDGLVLTIYETGHDGLLTPLVPLHVTPWYFGMTFAGNELDEQGQPTAASWWWGVVQASLRLMQQKIAVRHMGMPNRRQRKEAVRLGWKHETEVMVVRLRREASERKEPSGDGANYSHRFIRGAHWRNQWCGGKTQAHRLIWIHETIVGDESLPLVIKPGRAYTWDR